MNIEGIAKKITVGVLIVIIIATFGYIAAFSVNAYIFYNEQYPPSMNPPADFHRWARDLISSDTSVDCNFLFANGFHNIAYAQEMYDPDREVWYEIWSTVSDEPYCGILFVACSNSPDTFSVLATTSEGLLDIRFVDQQATEATYWWSSVSPEAPLPPLNEIVFHPASYLFEGTYLDSDVSGIDPGSLMGMRYQPVYFTIIPREYLGSVPRIANNRPHVFMNNYAHLFLDGTNHPIGLTLQYEP